MARRRAPRPLRRHPGGGQQRAPSARGTTKPVPAHRVRDLLGPISECHRGGRRVADRRAEPSRAVGRDRGPATRPRRRARPVDSARLQHPARRLDDVATGGVVAPDGRRPRQARMTVPAASRSTRASTRAPTPPASDAKAPRADGVGFSARNARRRLPCCRSVSTSRGKSTRTDSVVHVAGVDAGQQRLGQVVRGFSPNRRVTKAPIDSSSSSLPVARAGSSTSAAMRALPSGVKSDDVGQRPQRHGKTEERALGQRMQAPVAQHVGRSRLQRGDELGLQAQLGAQRRWRPASAGGTNRGRGRSPSRRSLGLHDAAGRWRRRAREAIRPARAQVVGSGQAGDAGADDDDVDRLVHEDRLDRRRRVAR